MTSTVSHKRRRQAPTPAPYPHRRYELPMLPLWVALFLCLLDTASAAVPYAAIEVQQHSSENTNDGNVDRVKTTTLLASGASFGGALPFGTRRGPPASSDDEDRLVVVEPPEDDPYLCNEYEYDEYGNIESYMSNSEGGSGVAMLVPRGECTFERKALSAQRLGSDMAVIRNTLESRYRLNVTSASDENDSADTTTDADLADASEGATYDDIIWPLNRNDYECSNGWALIPKDLFSFDPLPYNAEINDPLLSGTASEGNLCALGAGDTFENTCASRRCLLTGRETYQMTMTSGGVNETHMEACCAWDVYRNMGGDPRIGNTTSDTVTIPALFVNMEEGYALQEAVEANAAEGEQITALAYERWYPYPNASTFLLWTFAVFVTWISCYLSAWEYRKAYTVISVAKREGRRVFRVMSNTSSNNNAQRIEEGAAATAAPSETTPVSAVVTPPTPVDVQSGADDWRGPQQQEEQHEEGFEDEPMDIVELNNATDGQQQESRHDVSTLPTSVASANAPIPPIVPEASSPIVSSNFPSQRPVETSHHSVDPMGQRSTSSAGGATAASQPSSAAVAEAATRPPRTAGVTNTQEDHLDLNVYHVFGFVVFASAALFILFYFEIYRVVTVLYGIGCSGAMAFVIFRPLYRYLATKAGFIHILWTSPCPKAGCGCNTFSYLEILSTISGYAVGISWLYIGLTQLDPHSNTYYWVVQNIMGASVCIAFLGVIRISSIKIATILLVAVFIYDIFMVFISPYFTKEGDSIMVTVATSGGPPEDPDFCEKYPGEGDCRKGDPLPMVLTIPRVNDYRGGANLLGLGDLVLPGLLIAFAARLDAAKRLLKLCTEVYRAEVGGPVPRRPSGSTVASSVDEAPDGARSDNLEEDVETTSSKWRGAKRVLFGGYFGPLIISYGFGLAMAFLAVHLMETGQPALLYLCPACLGMMARCGKAKGELKELWQGSNRIKKSDRIVSSVRSMF